MLKYCEISRKYIKRGLMGVIGSVSLVQCSHAMDIKSNQEGGARSLIDTTRYGIPANLRTGGNLLIEKVYQSLQEELLGRYGVLHDIARQKHDDIPLSDFEHRILTSDVITHIPVGIITAQAFNPADGLFETAIKLERLGLVIKDLTFPFVSKKAYDLRHVLMAHCFVKAGYYTERAVTKLMDNAEDQVDLETLDDMYKTGGQFFHWAAVHMPKNAGDIVERRANILFAKVSR